MGLKNVNGLIYAELIINSIRNKINSLVNMINNNIETQLDPSFRTGQFHIDGLSEP